MSLSMYNDVAAAAVHEHMSTHNDIAGSQTKQLTRLDSMMVLGKAST